MACDEPLIRFCRDKIHALYDWEGRRNVLNAEFEDLAEEIEKRLKIKPSTRTQISKVSERLAVLYNRLGRILNGSDNRVNRK